MADIENPVIFSVSTKQLLDDVRNNQAFNHTMWSSEELLSIRTEARHHYFNAQKGKCAFCKQSLSLKSSFNCQVEHIVPKSLHPEYIFTAENLCVICADCNEIKREQETLNAVPETIKQKTKRKKYPRSSNAFLIIHPHFDNYDDHILIVNGLYVDRGSKKGNFTIGACNLNRRLAKFGWEPEIVDDAVLMNEMNLYLKEKGELKRIRHLTNIKAHLSNM